MGDRDLCSAHVHKRMGVTVAEHVTCTGKGGKLLGCDIGHRTGTLRVLEIDPIGNGGQHGAGRTGGTAAGWKSGGEDR